MEQTHTHYSDPPCWQGLMVLQCGSVTIGSLCCPFLPFLSRHRFVFIDSISRGSTQEEKSQKRTFMMCFLSSACRKYFFTPRNSSSRVHIFSGNVASRHASYKPDMDQMLGRNISIKSEGESQANIGGSAHDRGACHSKGEKKPLLSISARKVR